MPESLTKLVPQLNVKWFEQINIGGTPKEENFAALDRLANDIWTANSSADK
jgi:hypothetical protein